MDGSLKIGTPLGGTNDDGTRSREATAGSASVTVAAAEAKGGAGADDNDDRGGGGGGCGGGSCSGARSGLRTGSSRSDAAASAASSSATISAKPESDAHARAGLPLKTCDASAPAVSSVRTHSTLLPNMATSSGVEPLRIGALTCAPASSSTAAQRSKPP